MPAGRWPHWVRLGQTIYLKHGCEHMWGMGAHGVVTTKRAGNVEVTGWNCDPQDGYRHRIFVLSLSERDYLHWQPTKPKEASTHAREKSSLSAPSRWRRILKGLV